MFAFRKSVSVKVGDLDRRSSPAMGFATPAALPARHRLHPPLSRRRAPLALASSKPVPATVARTGERVLVRPAAASTSAPLILCPSCGAAFSGAALQSAALVRCSVCSHEFTASPDLLYEQVSSSSKKGSAAVTVAKPPAPGEIRCGHFAKCAGCTISMETLSPPVGVLIGNFLRSLGFRGRFAVRGENPTGWRTHAKLAVRDLRGSPTLGLYRARTHDILPVPSCAVHAPEVNLAAAAVKSALAEVGAGGYVDPTGGGLCRYVLFSVQRHTRLVQVTLVWNARSWKEAQPHAQRVGALLWRLHGASLLHSVWFNWNTASGNAITSPDRKRFYRMHGAADFDEQILGAPVYFAPYAFRQANLDTFEKMLLPALLRYIPAGSSVVEFCAGVGLIGLAALRDGRLKKLVATEVNPAAEELFWKSLRAVRAPRGVLRPEVEYVVGSDAETVQYAHEDADIVIVDPPRAGLSERVVQSLARPPTRSRLKRIIYVSCGYDAFRREAGELVNSGNWKVVGAEGFVLFPGTDHVEILAVFDRPFLPKLEKEEEEEAEEEAGKVVGDARNRNGRGKGRRVKDKPVDTTRKKGTAPPMGRGRKTVGEGRPGGGKRGGRGWGK